MDWYASKAFTVYKFSVFSGKSSILHWRPAVFAIGPSPPHRAPLRAALVPGIGQSCNWHAINDLRFTSLPEVCFFTDLGQELFCNLLIAS